ncbi:MAG: DUF429 domain-containing protein [Nitrososphaerota archaeon]
MRPRYLIGVDLAASPRNPTGICLMTDKLTCLTWTAFTDQQILETVAYYRPAVTAFDAPLSRPILGGLRRCERELIREGIRLLPQTLSPMKRLAMRGMRLAERVRRMGSTVLETYPRGVQRLLGFSISRRPRHGVSMLRKLGVAGLQPHPSIHEADAAICAFLAYLWLNGLTKEYGDKREKFITMPKSSARRHLLFKRL